MTPSTRAILLSDSTSNSRSWLRLAAEDLWPFRWIKKRRDALVIRSWEKAGRPLPPPHAFKRALVKEIARQSRAGVFVETGTYYGDMVRAVINDFREIISVELGDRLHQLACRRFRGQSHVRLLLGDSAALMPQILATIEEPCVFWLDAHHSGPGTAAGCKLTPILDELRMVLNHNVSEHVILIDDARCFNGADGYPRLDDLRSLLDATMRPYELTVSDDVVLIWPTRWPLETNWKPASRIRAIADAA